MCHARILLPATPAWRRSLVKTNRDGSAGVCEAAGAELFGAWIEQGQVPVELRDGRAEPFGLQATSPKLEEEPCSLTPGGAVRPGSLILGPGR